MNNAPTAAAEKAYRAHLRRAYKAKHRKGIGQSVRMITAAIFTDLYQRRQDQDGNPINPKYRPGKAWLRRRLVYAKGFVDTLKSAGI
jgi:hypothetical protein